MQSSSTGTTNIKRTLPDGYAFVPIDAEQVNSMVKVAVLVRLKPDPVGGPLVLLRNTFSANVYLGCLVDHSGEVLDWLEIWVQKTAAEQMRWGGSRRLVLCNDVSDRAWRDQIEAFVQSDNIGMIRLGFETTHPLPTSLDLSLQMPIHPAEETSGLFWRLCTDEAVLQQKKLSAYGASTERYAWLPEQGADSLVAALNSGDNSAVSTQLYAKQDPNVVPFNPQACFLHIRKYRPLPAETFMDLLSNAPRQNIQYGQTPLPIDCRIDALSKNSGITLPHGRLFFETEGILGILPEVFYLKLKLLGEMLTSVYSAVQSQKRPFLNLRPESWRIEIGDTRSHLPALWTPYAVLNDTPHCVSVEVSNTDVHYYLPAIEEGDSIYRPILPPPVKGLGSIRIRQVQPDQDDSVVVEGTFSSHERLTLSQGDIVVLRPSPAGCPTELYAHLETDTALAPGEWRFRTLRQFFSNDRVQAFRQAEGIPLQQIPFDVIPMMSSPCDLYALAVTAVRLLLVDPETTLPKALDEMFSLAHQVDLNLTDGVALAACIQEQFDTDARWLQTLGPQHLVYDEVAAERAIAVIPHSLWHETLAIILTMLPGRCRECPCKDYGDAPREGMHTVFEPAIRRLERLTLKTRNMLFGNMPANRHIHEIISNYL